MWKHNDCFETWRWDVESWLKMVNCPCQPIRGQGLWFGPIRRRESWRLTNERTWDDEDAFWMRVNIGVICNRALWLIGCSCQSGAVCLRSCRHRLMSLHCCGDCSPCDDCCTLINITDMEHLSGEWAGLWLCQALSTSWTDAVAWPQIEISEKSIVDHISFAKAEKSWLFIRTLITCCCAFI